MPLVGLFRRDGGCATCGSQPDAMDPDDRASALDHQDAVSDTAGALVEKRKVGRVPSLRLDTLTEGQAAQILYVGPYTEEHPTIRQRGSDGPDGRTEQGGRRLRWWRRSAAASGRDQGRCSGETGLDDQRFGDGFVGCAGDL